MVAAQREEPTRGGSRSWSASSAEARTPLDPEGQVFIEGALWSARLLDDGTSLRPGDRVRVESIDGLTLLVRPRDLEKGAG